MKKRTQIKGIFTRLKLGTQSAMAFAGLSSLSCLLISPTLSHASIGLDKQFNVNTIGILRPWDNVDGLFSEPVVTAYKSLFSDQHRYLLVDLDRVDSVLTQSKLPYQKLILEKDILNQITRSAKVDSLIRTRIIKEGKSYTFTLEWLHAPQMEILGSETFILPEKDLSAGRNNESINREIRQHFGKILSNFPLLGNVTGIDRNSVVINMAQQAEFSKGDTLMIGTVDGFKKHPILNTIVDWKITPVGSVVVEQVDEGTAFCRISETSKGQKLTQNQKVIQVVQAPQPPLISESIEAQTEKKRPEDRDAEPPKFGWVSLGLVAGNYDRSYSTGSSNLLGSGTSFGARGQGELWLTQNWIFGAEFTASSWSFSQKSAQTGIESTASQNGGVPGSLFAYKFYTGYLHRFSRDLYGPQVWAKLGIKSLSTSLPTSQAENTASMSITSPYIGLGGSLPILPKWSLFGNFNFRVLSSVNAQNLTSAEVNSTSDSELSFGASYQFTPRIFVRGALEIISTGATFADGTNVSQKFLTFCPALLYYF